MRIAVSMAAAGLCWLGAAAPARAAEPEVAPAAAAPQAGPSRAQVEQRIREAEASRGGGVVGIVVGALAIVGGVVSLVNEENDEYDRDTAGYDCGPSSCEQDSDEEPNPAGFFVGLAVGAGLVAAGTVGVVRSSQQLKRLRRQQRQLALGYDPQAGVATVSWNF